MVPSGGTKVNDVMLVLVRAVAVIALLAAAYYSWRVTRSLEQSVEDITKASGRMDEMMNGWTATAEAQLERLSKLVETFEEAEQERERSAEELLEPYDPLDLSSHSDDT